MSTKKDSIRLSTYDELFSSPPKPQKSSLKKFKSFKRRSVQLGKGAELFAALQKQRVVIDEKAIHFVAEARTGKRADARNSVFKLAQKYQILPDRERVQRIKQLYGKVKENEDSGDEAWDNSCTKLPGKLDPDAYLRLVRKEDIKDHQHLLNEMEEINQETAALSEDVCTPEGITDQDRLNELEMIIEENEKKQHSSSSPSSSSPPSSSSESELNKTEEEGEEENHKTSDDDEDDSDLEFDEEDMKTLNSLQREFVGNNLYQWFKEIQKTYESGVKLVKVNRMGYKFIRIVTIKDMMLTIKQPHTHSQANVDRQLSLHTVVSVSLGKESKEFNALQQLVAQHQEAPEFNPKGTVCCVVCLPKNRSLSLVFLDEDNRNGFVFFLRVLIKKARAAVQQLEQQTNN